MAARAPEVTHLREVDSRYLLSGMLRCGRCGATMVGQGYGDRYRYYYCGTARRKGKEACAARLLPKNRVENLVTNQMKDYILTRQNLEELVKLTNEELAQMCREEKDRLELVQDQISDLDSRLSRLYDALETGSFESDDLAPRIRALVRKREKLLQTKVQAEKALSRSRIDPIEAKLMKKYAQDLQQLLMKSSLAEQRDFLKSFVEKIEAGDSELKVYYTVPMPPYNGTRDTSQCFVFRTPRLKERGTEGVRWITNL